MKFHHKLGGRERSDIWAKAAEVIRRYEAGEGQNSIAEDLDCSHSLIKKILQANDIPINPNPRKVTYTKRKGALSVPYPADQYVSRDPCPRCGTRGDVLCRHSAGRLGTAFSGVAA